MTRFLCLCEGGNVRSVAMAQILKKAGRDALAAGLRDNTPETIRFLAQWADVIVLMAAELRALLPDALRSDLRIRVVDVGPDRYGKASHPELRAQIKPVVARWQSDGWAA